MIVEVKYMAPVWVSVDTDSGRVMRVVIDDTAVALADPPLVQEPDGGRIDGDEVELITDMAERGDWPSWERGG